MKLDGSHIERHWVEIHKRVRLINDALYEIDGRALKVNFHRPYLHKTIGSDQVVKKVDALECAETLIRHLTEQLYWRIYCGLTEDHIPPKLPLLKEREQFMHHLSAVNRSTNAPDLNWELLQLPNVEAKAVKNGIARPMIEGTFVRKEGNPKFVDFLRSAENRQSHPLYYCANSNAYLSPDHSLLRIYWNVKAEGVPLLVQEITRDLNFYKTPFLFKCFNHPTLYLRPDNAVLFIEKLDLVLIKKVIAPIINRLKDYLHDSEPLFTTKLYPGVGLASNPGIELSHGWYMMEKVARRLVDENWPLTGQIKKKPGSKRTKKKPASRDLSIIST